MTRDAARHDPLNEIPDDDRVPAHPHLVHDSRRGCSVWGYLAIALLVGSIIAAPRPAQPAEVSVWPSQQVAPVTAERTGAPWTLVCAVASVCQSNRQASGVGVRSSGDYQPASQDADVAAGWQPETTKPPPAFRTAALVTFSGMLAYADPSYGTRYLAIRQPRGSRVQLCGPAACLERISTDFGPSPWMARKGRIADVSAADFTVLCGVPLSFGLCPGTLTLVGLPNTDTGGRP